MEIKKTDKASLKGMRPTMFLLGLVVMLSLFLVALEYNSGGGLDYDEDFFDDLPQEAELLPALRHDDIQAMQVPVAPAPVVKEKYNVIENAVQAKMVERGTETPQVSVAETDVASEKEAPVTATPISTNEKAIDFRVVERLPEFPGGMTGFMKWLTKNLKYPVVARENKIQGKVIVSFIINKDGGISDAKVVRQVSPYLDREAMRVIRMMPKWKPGEDKGKPCRTMMVVPVVFAL